MDWYNEQLEINLALAIESTPENTINSADYEKGIVYATRYALETFKYGIKQGYIKVVK